VLSVPAALLSKIAGSDKVKIMFYKFLNRRISDKISELHPIAINYLSDDIKKNDDKALADRLKVVRNHALLHKHFEADQKRLYMINRNYLNFLKAIIFLYRTSQVSVSAGVLTAPAEFYHTISAVQNSFEELTRSLSLVTKSTRVKSSANHP
jgi:thiamine kinase-like enzyme